MEVLYMTDKGRVTIPNATRVAHGLGEGSRLLFLETKSGALVLKPVKEKPEKTLVEHLQKFQGVEWSERAAHCPPRV